MAEKKGFEPLNPFTGYTISSRAPSTKLGDFSIYETVDASAGRRAGASADLKREAVGQRQILYHSIVRLSMEKSFLCFLYDVRASSIGNMKAKQQSVRGRVEIFRLYGCRKILPDLDRDDLKIIEIGSMNRKVHRTLITSHPSKAAIPDWENAYPDKS